MTGAWREVVVLMGETAGQKKQKMLPIIRTDAGGFFGFGEFDLASYTDFQGRFAGLLPPKVPNAKQRGLAKAMLAAMGVADVALGRDFLAHARHVYANRPPCQGRSEWPFAYWPCWLEGGEQSEATRLAAEFQPGKHAANLPAHFLSPPGVGKWRRMKGGKMVGSGCFSGT
jgi:hypothetical protein